MKKKNLLLGLVLGMGLCFGGTKKVMASLNPSCGVNNTGLGETILAYPKTQSHVITVDLSDGFDENDTYHLTVERGMDGIQQTRSPDFTIKGNFSDCRNGKDCIQVQNRIVTWTINSEKALSYKRNIMGIPINNLQVDLIWRGNWEINKQCDVGNYTIDRVNAPGSCDGINAFQVRDGKNCYLNENTCTQEGKPITVEIKGLKDVTKDLWTTKVGLRIQQDGGGEWDGKGAKPINGNVTLSFTPHTSLPSTGYEIFAEERKYWNEDFPGCSLPLTVSQGCNTEDACLTKEEASTSIDTKIIPFELCNQIPDSQAEAKGKCTECLGNDGVWTALGCIDTTSTQGVVGKLMTVGMSIAGGIALLMILAAAFMFATSEGEPKRTSEAKEILTSAIIGLIFIIFSVTILQFIGVNILHIPGFGE